MLLKQIVMSAYFTVMASGTENDGKHNYLLRALHNNIEYYISYSQTNMELKEWDKLYMRVEIECHNAHGVDGGFNKIIKICNLNRILHD